MSQLHTKDPQETNSPWAEKGQDPHSLIKKESEQSWQHLWKKKYVCLWPQIEAPQPQGSVVPGMLHLEGAIQRQHTCPLWEKRCMSLSKEKERQRQ